MTEAEATTEVIEATTTDEFTVKDRLRATVDELMETAELPKAVKTLGSGFFANFLNNTDSDRIAEMLVMMRDELIPMILGENLNDSTDKSE